MCSVKWTRIYRIALEATVTSSQVQAAVYLRIKRACESAPVLLFPSLPGGNPPHPSPINWTPPPILLHPANTNTPSSHWKTSVFWGQAQGSTSNLPQWSHMKHLEAGQGKQGRKELGFCSRGGGWGNLDGSKVRASGWLSLGLKKASLSAVCSAALGSAPYTSSKKG